MTAILSALESGAAGVFGALSAVRRARIFHPEGSAFTGVVTIDEGDHPLDLLPRRSDAIVRLSRGVGLPAPLPDILGVAVKLLNAHGAGAHQDFLLASSGAGFPGHHVLVPARDAAAAVYSSVLPYRNVRGDTFLVGALPNGGTRRFDLAVAARRGRWRTIGAVDLGDELTQEQSDRLRFTPWHSGGGLEPAGLLNRVRRGAYEGSQRARPDTDVPTLTAV